jgi:hypothetical protein
LDWAISVLLIALIVAYGAAFVDFNAPPYEDAAMLMRYADHLARGYGVVWNTGERPVDGATDFLFMAAAAALIKSGLAIGRSVRIIGYASHVLTVLLVYWVNRSVWRAGRAVSLVAAVYLAVGTGLWYVGAFFGTTFFALFAATTWSLGILIIKAEAPGRWLSAAFAVSALLMGLIRPEGVVLAGLMMLGVILAKGWRSAFPALLMFAAVMLLVGGTYFVWHWTYFGYPVPNPYYKKGGGLLHWDSFWESIGNLARFAGPFLLAFILGFRSRVKARLTLALLVPLVAFAAAFVLVSNETNFGGRFQYALWPLILIGFYPLVAGLDREIGISWPPPAKIMPRAVGGLVVLVLTYGLVRYSMLQSCTLTMAQQTCGVAYEADGRYEVAKYLAQYQGEHYVLATTEAGLLPLYSGWRAVDAWGLNDAWIAHNGQVTPEYLDRYRPNAIVFHAYFSPLVPPRINDKNMQQDWFRMTLTLKNYAEANHYVLAAAFGDSPYEAHYYYVRPDFPDSERISRAISAMKDYRWFASGRRAINYAGLQP